MENESQKLYRVIISLYAEISRNSKRSLNGSRTVHRFHRERLAREIEKIYPVHFNNPENLWSINAFVEHVKRFNKNRRLPEIEEEIIDILWLFFRDKEWKDDEIIFEHIPEMLIDKNKKMPLKKVCLDILQAEIGRSFEIRPYGILLRDNPFFFDPFTLRELIEWVYLHETQKVKRG